MSVRHTIPSLHRAFTLLTLAIFSAVAMTEGAAEGADGPGTPSLDARAQAAQVRTILLKGQVSTWLNQPQPPYQVVITIKMKLERVGYRVVLDSQQPHDAVLNIAYQETEGRQYRALQYGTDIRCEVALHLPPAASAPSVWSRRFESGTSWPTPVGSLYWEAVQNLEEEPYYYFLGELLKGWLDRQEEAPVVFISMLQESRGRQTTEGGGFQPTARETANQGARLNAIGELGRLRERRALPLLWTLAQAPSSPEGEAALTAIGEIGGRDSLDRLITFAESQSDPDVKAVAQKAMARARERQDTK